MAGTVVPATPHGPLILDREVLTEAGLGERVRIIVGKGEIRIVAVPRATDTSAPEATLEELAGCLGEEPALAYDFQLKIGGLYEAR
jgi:hypothetical protein